MPACSCQWTGWPPGAQHPAFPGSCCPWTGLLPSQQTAEQPFLPQRCSKSCRGSRPCFSPGNKKPRAGRGLVTNQSVRALSPESSEPGISLGHGVLFHDLVVVELDREDLLFLASAERADVEIH